MPHPIQLLGGSKIYDRSTEIENEFETFFFWILISPYISEKKCLITLKNKK